MEKNGKKNIFRKQNCPDVGSDIKYLKCWNV